MAEQVLLVPAPAIRVHVEGIPVGSEPLKVTVPVALALYNESPLATVAVQDSDTLTAPGDGKQTTESEVVDCTFSAVGETVALRACVVSPA
ncbi:MAG: hypothetical protein OK422_00015 [Thaumarchaeota archaeon]|nr:hypothetical protein [Nitrososphaerota archaeon]